MEFHPLWPSGPVYGGDKVSSDSLALADFAGDVPAARAADLGCGCGILSLLLCLRRPEITTDGVELRESAAALCRENFRRNGLAGRCTVRRADLRSHPLETGAYDLVLSNPPYFAPRRGAVSPDPDRALMRTESASLPELAAAAAELLRPGGSFCLVHRRERREELFSALLSAGLAPARYRELRSRQESPGRVFLLEARKGPAGPLRAEPPLCQFGPDGRETAEYRKICHWEY